jgi:hypothetical protein
MTQISGLSAGEAAAQAALLAATLDIVTSSPQPQITVAGMSDGNSAQLAQTTNELQAAGNDAMQDRRKKQKAQLATKQKAQKLAIRTLTKHAQGSRNHHKNNNNRQQAGRFQNRRSR